MAVFFFVCERAGVFIFSACVRAGDTPTRVDWQNV
jgi:hypothetical protein